MSLGERITELRKACGLSQYQLAKEMEVSRQAVSKWENGQAVPDAGRIIQDRKSTRLNSSHSN